MEMMSSPRPLQVEFRLTLFAPVHYSADSMHSILGGGEAVAKKKAAKKKKK